MSLDSLLDSLMQLVPVNAEWLITNVVSAFLLPPLNLVLLALFGFMMWRWLPRFGAFLCLMSLTMLVLFSTVAGSRLLTTPLEAHIDPWSPEAMSQAQAIVVLGGGRHKEAAEYEQLDSPSLATLGRLRYAAHLQRKTNLPVLVTGGAPEGVGESEAAVMARVLQQDFHVPVRWKEEASRNTAENGVLSANLLREAGIERILLVTDAIHMPRAQQVFRRQGLHVTAAPTYYHSHGRLRQQDFIPGARGFQLSYYALHEWIGLMWYRQRQNQKPLSKLS